ncbi:MAG: hypothetical protein ABJA81_10170 [Nocardioidaceae bacterium]
MRQEAAVSVLSLEAGEHLGEVFAERMERFLVGWSLDAAAAEREPVEVSREGDRSGVADRRGPE